MGLLWWQRVIEGASNVLGIYIGVYLVMVFCGRNTVVGINGAGNCGVDYRACELLWWELI